MKAKNLLKFYFAAERLDKTMDGLIAKKAFSSAAVFGRTEDAAEEICGVIYEKSVLSQLWNYLDNVIQPFSEKEKTCLEEYAFLRTAISSIACEKRKKIRNAVIRFTRKARRIQQFAEGIGLINKYYCLLY